MERRKFLRNVGFGTSLSLLNQTKIFAETGEEIIQYQYPKPANLMECVNESGNLAVWFEFAGKFDDVDEAKNSFDIKKGEIEKTKHFYFYSGDFIEKEQISPSFYTKIISVVWLTQFSEDTEFYLQSGKKVSFILKELLDFIEWKSAETSVQITSKLLLHNEIGEINFEKTFGLNNVNKEDFTFVLMADPQGGDPNCEGNKAPTRVKIHNAFIEDSIGLVNNLEDKPAFTLVIGDYTDSQGEQENFMAMEKMFRQLKTPLLLEIGNHETRYNMKSEPGYFMDGFSNFFTAQKRMNGMEKLLYSFNIGSYHFIVWPDPLRSGFWENHPHYFEWLEHDLEKYKNKLTFFFQHVPIHPIGIDPIQNYSESPYVKRKLLEILSKWGNVKYVFSGHVHIPIKSSVKTSCTFEGINFINLPAAGYRPRAFGEEDYFGGPCQGITVISVKNKEIKVEYKDVTQNVFQYENKFENLNLEKDKLWFNYKWELPLNNEIVNGNFSGFEKWHRPFIYTEDVHPANICEIQKTDKENLLYLRTKKRGYDVPGQDRLPQIINSVCQAIYVKNGVLPCLSFEIKIVEGLEEKEALKGVYIWCEGYHGPNKVFNLVYSHGIAPGNLNSRSEASNDFKTLHFDLAVDSPDWKKVTLNLNNDVDAEGPEITECNRLVISFGVWNVNDGNNKGTGILFKNVNSNHSAENTEYSTCGKQTITLKNRDKIYYTRVVHIAGEHTLGSQEQLYL